MRIVDRNQVQQLRPTELARSHQPLASSLAARTTRQNSQLPASLPPARLFRTTTMRAMDRLQIRFDGVPVNAVRFHSKG